MALFEDVLKGGTGTGLLVGLGAVLLAPTVLPTVGRVLRPVAKTVIKTGMVLYNETLSGVGEVTGDIVAEARAELEQEQAATNGGGRTQPASRRTKAEQTA
ncbi:DUF5132 domain-containing protein [Inquilinus limosus]|uniref:DUF5132 domain-containing protein n=1 Tax=Inquilinus limosus TaxID=171674 RepID=UPI000407AF9F|nr:DUF5132 domain-containing protein [Inquilinus limosus]